MIEQLTVAQLKELKDNNQEIELIDVRGEDEYEFANINGKLIPLPTIANRINEIDKTKQVIVMCHHGGRSMMACQLLEENGFEKVYNLEGGIHKWSLEIDKNIPTY